MATKAQIQTDYTYCEKIIKKHSKSFYFAFSRLPKEKAQAIYAVYAFCRFADDSVDEHSTQEKQTKALDEMEVGLNLFSQNRAIDHPLWRALRDVFNTFNMDIIPFYDQLKGQRMDIHFESPDSFEDLEYYSTLVAGTVGLMLLPIIASETDYNLDEIAIDLGIAMQITNILRDIGEDFRDKNRIYLPLAEMEKENYSLLELERAEINDSFIKLWEKLARNAEVRYTRFEDHIHFFDEDSREQVAISARVYRAILDAVRTNKYNCFTKRNFISKSDMVNLSLNSLIKS